MMTWEIRLQNHFRKNILWWAFAAIFVLGVFMRYSLLPQKGTDLEFYFANWILAMQKGDLRSVLAPELGYSYSALHLYLWGLAARLFPNAYSPTLVKCVSMFMEAFLVAFACLLTWHLLPKERRKIGLFVVFTLLWMNPVLLLNASGWGQTDTGYVALSVLSVWLLTRDKPVWSMVAFGLALAFKLQAVLLLPALLIAYFCYGKKFSLLWFFLIPAVWILSGVPMVFLGESPLYAVNVYLTQTDIFSKPTSNCPNAFALLGDALGNRRVIEGMWQRYGMVLTFAALGGMATWLIHKRTRLNDRTLVLLSSWCVLACIFFLPRMHERYGLPGEILLLIWAVLLWKPRGFVYVLLGLLPTLSAYCEYLFRFPMFSLQLGAVMNLTLLGLLTWELVRETNACDRMPEVEPFLPKAVS